MTLTLSVEKQFRSAAMKSYFSSLPSTLEKSLWAPPWLVVLESNDNCKDITVWIKRWSECSQSCALPCDTLSMFDSIQSMAVAEAGVSRVGTVMWLVRSYGSRMWFLRLANEDVPGVMKSTFRSPTNTISSPWSFAMVSARISQYAELSEGDGRRSQGRRLACVFVCGSAATETQPSRPWSHCLARSRGSPCIYNYATMFGAWHIFAAGTIIMVNMHVRSLRKVWNHRVTLHCPRHYRPAKSLLRLKHPDSNPGLTYVLQIVYVWGLDTLIWPICMGGLVRLGWCTSGSRGRQVQTRRELYVGGEGWSLRVEHGGQHDGLWGGAGLHKDPVLIVTPSGQKCSSVTLSLCCLSTTRRAHAVPKLRLEGNTRQLVVIISCAWQYFAISSAVQSRSRFPTKKTTRPLLLALLRSQDLGRDFLPAPSVCFVLATTRRAFLRGRGSTIFICRKNHFGSFYDKYR